MDLCIPLDDEMSQRQNAKFWKSEPHTMRKRGCPTYLGVNERDANIRLQIVLLLLLGVVVSFSQKKKTSVDEHNAAAFSCWNDLLASTSVSVC